MSVKLVLLTLLCAVTFGCQSGCTNSPATVDGDAGEPTPASASTKAGGWAPDTSTPSEEVITKEAVASSGNGYFEHEHDGRIYVLGSVESSDSFRQTKSLPYALTLINAGPNGETIVLEVDKKDASLQQRLLAEYKMRHEFYAQVQHEGRIYVLGSQESLEKFEDTRSLPYALTLINAGPGGETVVFEVDKENPRLQERLREEFNRRHNYYAEVIQDGRIYVLGSAESHESFKETGNLPYAFTLINAGPDGETVVFEVDKKSTRLQERLQSEFERRHAENG